MQPNRWPAIAVLAAVLLTFPVWAHAQRGRGGAPDPVLDAVELKPDLYFIPGAGANSIVRVTPEGLILVDTKNPSPEIAAALLEQIRSISTLPVLYVLNTHHHPDHVGNNQVFVDEGATVVGLEAMSQLMTTDPRTREIPGAPTVTFQRDYILVVGDARVEAHFYGASHTGGDTIVYMPDKGVVMLSDAFNGTAPTPRLIFGNGGSAVQVPGLLDSILALDWDVAISGRGDPLSRADIEAYRAEWGTFMDRVRSAVANGATRETLAAQVSQDDLRFEFDDAFFAGLFDELQANPTGEARLPL